MEKLKMWRKKQRNGDGEWTSSFAGDPKVNAELRKLTNSPGWVAASRKVLPGAKSPGSSRASTPSNISSASSKTKKKTKKKKNASKSEKKFKMVLEKDEEYEVDYVSPDDGNTEDSESESKGLNSDTSEDEYSLNEDEEVSSIDDEFLNLEDEYSDVDIDEDFPPLELPESSRDLLILPKLLLTTLGVYEVLRHFRSCLRLSPMLFEDFCAALIDDETNILLTECYLSVLKALLREEDAAGVQFGPPDQKDSAQAAVSFLDHMTWPEVTRAYLQSMNEHHDEIKILENPKFPRVDVNEKLTVLKTLTDIYLASNKIRDQLMTDGVIRYDDNCRVCHKLGDLLCCETCPAVYHLACCDPPLTEVPDDEWQCEICVAHKLNGVYNCEPKHEFKGQYLRHDPIGVDRHGNKYWFLSRRLIIEGSENVWYYSTQEQFDIVRSMLDPDRYEMVLCEALKDVAEDFPKCSKITHELTQEALPDDKPTMYLDALKARVIKENEEKKKKAEEEKRKFEEEEKRKQEKEKQKQEEEKRKLQEELEKNKENNVDDNLGEKTQPSDPNKTADNIDTNTEASSEVKELSSAPTTTEENVVMSPSTPVTVESQHLELSQTSDSQTSSEVAESQTLATSTATMGPPLTTGSQLLASQGQISVATNVQQSTPVVTKVTTPTVTSSGTSIDSMPKLAPTQARGIQLLKFGQSLPMKKPQQSSLSQLKTLFVLNKDGTRTQLTLGPAGKLLPSSSSANSQSPTNRQILVLNSAKVALPKVGGEIKNIKFAPGATQKMEVENKTPGSEVSVKSLPKKQLTHEEEAELYFRLGEDKAYRQYVNHYTENTLALNKHQHKEERDKERYLSYKFSMSGEGDFKWIGDILGCETTMLETLRSTLLHLEHQIPLCFMHTKWERYRKAWGKIVMTCDTPQRFAAALGVLEMATRVVVKKSVWKNSHGLPRMKRVTTSEKEEWDKKRKHKTRYDEEESNRNAVWCKYTIPVKSGMVWKVRGEEYRMTGYGGWIWISTTRTTKLRPYVPKPYTLVHEKDNVTKNESSSTEPDKDCQSMDVDANLEISTTSTTKSSDLADDKVVHDAIMQETTSQSEPVNTSTQEIVKSSQPSYTEACDIIIKDNDVINVSDNLSKHSPIYNKKWTASKVDILLGWRMVQKSKEEGSTTIASNDTTESETTKPVVTATPVVMRSDSITTTTDVKKPTDVTMATSVAVVNSTATGSDVPVALATPSKVENVVTMVAAEKLNAKNDVEIDILGDPSQEEGQDVNQSIPTNEEPAAMKATPTSTQQPMSGDGALVNQTVVMDNAMLNSDMISEPLPMKPLTIIDNIPCIKEEIFSDTEMMPKEASMASQNVTDALSDQEGEIGANIDSDTQMRSQTVPMTSQSVIDAISDQDGEIDANIGSETLTVPMTSQSVTDATLDKDGGHVETSTSVTGTKTSVLALSVGTEAIQEENVNSMPKIVSVTSLRGAEGNAFGTKTMDGTEPNRNTMLPSDSGLEQDLAGGKSISCSMVQDDDPKLEVVDKEQNIDNTKHGLGGAEENAFDTKAIGDGMEPNRNTMLPTDSGLEQGLAGRKTVSCSMIQDDDSKSEVVGTEQNVDNTKHGAGPIVPTTITESNLSGTDTIKPDAGAGIVAISSAVDCIEPSAETNAITEIKQNETPADVETVAGDDVTMRVDKCYDDVTVTNAVDCDTETCTITTVDSMNFVDSLVDTVKTTVTSENETITVVETCTTTICKTTTVTKTITTEPSTGSTGALITPEPKRDCHDRFDVNSSNTGTNVTAACSAIDADSNATGIGADASNTSTNDGTITSDTNVNVTEIGMNATNTDRNASATIVNATKMDTSAANTSTDVGSLTTNNGANVMPVCEVTEFKREPIVYFPKLDSKSSKKSQQSQVYRSTYRLSRMSRARLVTRATRNGTLTTTQKVWKLERYKKTTTTLKKDKTMKLPLPWKFCTVKQKKKSIFRLPSSVIRRLALSGGQWAYRAGFTFGAKWFSGLEQYWLYPCPRPTFGLTWRYKLQNVTTYASVAHLLRVFWHAIKWDKMTMRPQTDDVAHSIQTDNELITTELLKRKDNLSTGLHSEYFVRRITVPIVDPEEEAARAIKPAEGYTPSRQGLRSSRRSTSTLSRPSKRNSEPQVDMIWVPEEQVELWQIRQFDIMLKQQNQLKNEGPMTTSSPTSLHSNTILQNGTNTFITTPSGGILPTLQNIRMKNTESMTIAGPGFNIVKLPLHQNAQLLQNSLNAQQVLNTKPVIGKTPVQKILIQPSGQQFSAYKQIGVDNQQSPTLVRSQQTGTHYIVQGGKIIKPIIIKAGPQIMSSPKPSFSTIRTNDLGSQTLKFKQQPPILPTIKKSPISITPRTPTQTPRTTTPQYQVTLSSSQLSQLLKIGSNASARVSVSLGQGRSGVGQIQLIPPGAQVNPTSSQQLMQAKVGGEVRKFLITLISENPPTPASPVNEVSLKTASLSQRLQQIQRQQYMGKNKNTDMKKLMTDKDPLWGSKPQSATPYTSYHDIDRPKKRPPSKILREEGQRQSVVAQVMKSILDRIERKEEMETRKRKREEALIKQKEKKEQTEQMKVFNRQSQILHRHRDQLKQDILKRRAVVEKYLTHSAKNELREDQRKHRRGGSGFDSTSFSKRPKKTYGNAIVTSAVLTENNSKRPISEQRRNQPIAPKKRRSSSPPPEKLKMISTKKRDTKLYCICKTPYDSTKFYIGCDLCMNWFHGSCVGIPESRAKHMNEWVCDDCTKVKEEPAQELYCICRTPYDDSKFYIGCDVCQDWYHGYCVGISEKEAEKIEFYSCPRCKNRKKNASSAISENLLTESDYQVLSKVIRSLRAHKMAWPFLQPVSKYEVPNYHKVIKKPMDLGTVMTKLPSYKLLSELVGDVSLIFDNCRMFNGADSALAKCAEIVESVFVGKMREFRSRRKSK